MSQEDLRSESNHIHQWNWTEDVGHIFTLQDSSLLLNLALGCIFLFLCLDFFLCNSFDFSCPCSAHSLACLALHPEWQSKMFCADMLANDLQRPAHDSQPVMHLPQMGGYCLSLAPQLEAPWAKQF